MLLILKLIFVVLGIALWREIRLSMSSIRVERWRQTEGRLESLSETAQGEGDKPADFSYSFSVDGENYQATRIGFGFPERLKDLVAKREFSDLLSKSPELSVFYDPWNPRESSLIAGFRPFHAIKIVPLFILFFATGIAAFG